MTMVCDGDYRLIKLLGPNQGELPLNPIFKNGANIEVDPWECSSAIDRRNGKSSFDENSSNSTSPSGSRTHLDQQFVGNGNMTSVNLSLIHI